MNRRIVVVAALLGMLCVALAAGAAALLLLRGPNLFGATQEAPGPLPAEGETSPPPTPADTESQMVLVEQQVSALRGLEALTDVRKSFMTEGELRDKIEADFEEDYSPQEARDDALVLSAFDFLSPDLDLYQLYIDLYAEQIGGFYDTEEKEFFLISSQTALGSYERLIFAHEFTHALQDQHFDLEHYDIDTLYDENPDAGLALSALVEGDAQFLTEQYLADHFAPEDMQSLFTQLNGIETSVYDSSPVIVQRDLGFPYLEGSRFVQALYEEGGWRFVDTAYANPPASTEQILHPRRYLDGDQPQPVTLQPALDALGGGWHLVDESTLGEFYLLVYLEQRLASEEAAAAAEGWGGDHYAVYHNEQSRQSVMVLATAWDSPGEAQEFASAYSEFGTARAGREPTTDRPDLTCWTASDYLCVALQGGQTWLALGPNRATLRGVLAAQGINDE